MEIKDIIGKMTLEEKICLLSGRDFWSTKEYKEYGIPSLFMCDGPNGLRKQDRGSGAYMLGVNDSLPAACYPASVTVAGSWNTERAREIGRSLALEAREKKAGMVLGPGANIKRNPLCGRSFEYHSEDPVLSGEMAAAFIEGMEGEGISSCLKHFACNNQEKSRFTSDSVLSERALREIYLRSFEIAVKKGKPSSVMSAYPKINGVHCSDNKELLTDILRDEWGFDGMVVTDWGGLNNKIEAVKAGNDLCMPGGSDFMEKELLEAVKEGKISESEIDKCAQRIIRAAIKAEETLKEDYTFDAQAGYEAALSAACEGAVLLKNDGKLLPLSEDKKVTVVGHMAEEIRCQGAGSSHVNIRKNHQIREFFTGTVYAEGCDKDGNTSDSMLSEVKEKCSGADAVIVFAGLPDKYESEGFDRDDMKIPEGHLRMIDAACDANDNVIVILLCGCVVECPFADRVKSVLYMGLAGEATAQAVYKLIYGEVNPSGKLAESWPYRYEDVSSSGFYAKEKDALYLEDIYVGYRYYEKAGVEVRWPFGHGLSYTDFEYSGISVKEKDVTFTLRNTGDREGKETVQLYIGQKNPSVYRPLKELKHFQKVSLLPGESKEVSFALADEDFRIWDDGWKVPAGDYVIYIGKSSRDIQLTSEIKVEGEKIETPGTLKGSWYESLKGSVTEDEWRKIPGVSYTPDVLKKGEFTMDNSVMEMRDYSLVMKIMYKATESVVAKGFGGKKDYTNPEFRMLINSSLGGPLRTMQISGGIKGGLFKGLLEMANGHYIKGIIRMIGG